MKKRVLAMLLAAACVFSLVACSSSSSSSSSSSDSSTAAEAEDADEDADEDAAEASDSSDSFYAGKTIELIVPWAAGGGADIACRLVTQYVEEELGCTIVINNVTGGGGSIGLNQLVESDADGLTLAYIANTDSNGDLMLEGVPYTAEDFAPICQFASDPHVILASNQSGITDLESLIEAGQSGTTLWGIGGAWTHWDFLKLEFEDATGTSFKRLVYDGGSAVITDIMSGDCTVGTPFISEALAAIDAGEAVAIAITSAERNDACPDIPTVAELGYEGFESTMWRGFAAPAGTDEEILREFAAAVEAACANEEFIAAAVEAGLTVSFMGYDDFQEFYWENHESVKAYYEANADM